MRDPNKIIDALKARCAIYKIERVQLLIAIDTLSNLLYEKYKEQDNEIPLTTGLANDEPEGS